MTPLVRVWNRFWFTPAGPLNLAAARVIVAVHALWILGSRDLAGVSGLPEVFWHGARAAARWRYLLFPGHAGLEQALTAVAAVSLIAVALGLVPRISCLLSALLLYHLAPLETIIWTSQPYERGLDLPVIALVVLAVAPCADALSVRGHRRAGTGRSPDYGWPLLLIQLVTAEVYLFAGYSKVYRVGFEWISSENIRRWLLVFNQQDQVAVFTWLGPALARHDAITLLIAVSAIALDFGFIAMLFWRRARVVILPLALLFHAGILFAMNIAFLNVPQLLVFVDWEALSRGRRSHETGDMVPAAATRAAP
jgi:hypothetical protein